MSLRTRLRFNGALAAGQACAHGVTTSHRNLCKEGAIGPQLTMRKRRALEGK